MGHSPIWGTAVLLSFVHHSQPSWSIPAPQEVSMESQGCSSAEEEPCTGDQRQYRLCQLQVSIHGAAQRSTAQHGTVGSTFQTLLPHRAIPTGLPWRLGAVPCHAVLPI